jgi:integrase
VVHIIESLAPRTAHQVFKQLNYCFKRLPRFKNIENISYEAIEAAVSRARKDSKAWHFAYIRRWYRWCYDQGLPGFNGEIAYRLGKLKISPNQKGQRVMSRDVDDGPLSHDEHFLVRNAVETPVGELIDRVIVMLLLETGARPVQLVLLEERDLFVTSQGNDHVFYSLDIPRAKQRHVGEPARKRRRISSRLGCAIEKLIEQNHATYGQLGPEMPILCTVHPNGKKLTKELNAKYRFHLKVATFTQHVSKYPNVANIVSPRTGKLLNLHSLRLRYTFFTNLLSKEPQPIT